MCRERIKAFGGDESGAITVDWVVLSAAAIGLALASFAAFSDIAANESQEMSNFAADYSISTSLSE